MKEKLEATKEQLIYAKILDFGMKVGLIILIVSFLIYLTGALRSHIPLSELPKYWGLPVDKYLAQTGLKGGWSWLSLITKGDFLNFIGVAFLASLTIICYIAIIPLFFEKRDNIYVALAVIEVLVLLFAASGILKA
ncbi:MAG: hypothetical protein QMD53_06395 [Actinomycetota bacterium]|nr:hypothetical protein [Actinomycetota bacterium]